MAIKAKSSQEFVPIKEVRDGIIVLKDGGLRAIVLANSINLSLKSQDEQQAIILQFQSFLNTLDFSTQMVVQSRKLDIRPYLLMLEDRMRVLEEPLLKLQTKEYIEFIKKFTESVNVMTKTFFVVVPYSKINIKTESKALTGLIFRNKDQNLAMDRQMDFEEERSQLEQRINVVEQGLARCGIKSIRLGSEEVVEIFYKAFNPGEQESKMLLENQT